ncbi:MAG: hypothetical protein LBH49_03830 [Puniceicoccales bacterium]|nr:hypothetical protein [Puniceicoccales bacterium]
MVFLIRDILLIPFSITLPILAIAGVSSPSMTNLVVDLVIGNNLANVCLAMGIPILISPFIVRSKLVPMGINYIFIIVVLTYCIWYTKSMPLLFTFVPVVLYLILLHLSILITSRSYCYDCQDQRPSKSMAIPGGIFCIFFGIGLTYMTSHIITPVIDELSVNLDVPVSFISIMILGPILSIPIIFRSLWAIFRGQNGSMATLVIYTNVCNISLASRFPCQKLPNQLSSVGMVNMLLTILSLLIIAKNRKLSKKGGFFLCMIYVIAIASSIILCNTTE